MLKVELPASYLPPPEERGEILDYKPFVIRGHHIVKFFVLKNKFPTELAEILASEAKRQWKITDENPNNPKAQRQQEYIQDLLGLSLENTDEYEDRVKRIFETFITLPDDHPAEIVEGVQDTLCSACVIGEHCKKLTITSIENGEAVNALEGDRMYMDRFIGILNLLNLPKPTITYEPAYFSDAEPRETRCIKTTIGVIRQVLEQTNSRPWS